MGCRSISGFLAVALLGLMVCSSQAYTFYVGGKLGWVLNPSESFNHWAERNRFQVNDTLVFKYKNGTDSVLVVSKDDYFSCNTKNPILSLQDGESIFKFDRSGPFYFISGNSDMCQKGQKLIVVVLALTHKQHHAPPPCSSSPPPKAESPSAESSPEKPGASVPAPAPAKNSAVGGPVGFSFGGGILINAVLLSSFLVGLL